MNEDKVLEALAQLNATMQQGFSEMSGRFEDIERRLGKQPAKDLSSIKIQKGLNKGNSEKGAISQAYRK